MADVSAAGARAERPGDPRWNLRCAVYAAGLLKDRPAFDAALDAYLAALRSAVPAGPAGEVRTMPYTDTGTASSAYPLPIRAAPAGAGTPSEREQILDAALRRCRQGYENLIELDLLPHSGYDDATREIIAEIDAALRSAGASPGAARGEPGTFGELWDTAKRELMEKVHGCVGWHDATSITMSVGFLRNLADAIADSEGRASVASRPAGEPESRNGHGTQDLADPEYLRAACEEYVIVAKDWALGNIRELFRQVRAARGRPPAGEPPEWLRPWLVAIFAGLMGSKVWREGTAGQMADAALQAWPPSFDSAALSRGAPPSPEARRAEE